MSNNPKSKTQSLKEVRFIAKLVNKKVADATLQKVDLNFLINEPRQKITVRSELYGPKHAHMKILKTETGGLVHYF